MPTFLNATHLVTTYGLIGLFVTIFLESGIFFALPGDSLLFTAGLLAPALGLNIMWLFVITSVAAVLGSILGYVIGIYIERLHKYAFFRKLLSREHLEKARGFFVRYGKQAVFLARFMPVVRTFVPIAAGVADMDKKAYGIYATLGAVVWSGVFLFSGFYLGKLFPHLSDYLTYIIAAVVVVSILPGVYGWYRARHQRVEE